VPANHQGSMVFPAPRDEVFEACLQAVRQSGFHIAESKPEAGQITATARTSLRSWGEHITIAVSAEGRVDITSSSRGVQIVDYGKNKANVRALFSALALLLPSQAPARSAPSATASGLPATRSTVIEQSREEVAIGEETRAIDNSRSTSPTSRLVRLTREWTRTCTVDIDRTTTIQGSAGLSAHILEFKAAAERTLSKNYSTTSAETETFTEEVTLNIAAHTKSEIIFSWKEIHQKGVVQLAGQEFEVRIPYEVVVGLTFDQQQIDTP